MNKNIREEFEDHFPFAVKHKTEHGYTGEYYEIWEGFQVAWIIQQKRVEELERVLKNSRDTRQKQSKQIAVLNAKFVTPNFKKKCSAKVHLGNGRTRPCAKTSQQKSKFCFMHNNYEETI